MLRVIDGKNWGEQDFFERLKLAGKGRELPKTRFLIFFAKKQIFLGLTQHESLISIFCFVNPFLTLHKKRDQNLQETANLDTFTGEILNRKLYFCAVDQSSCYWVIIKKALKIICFPIIWMGDEILKNHRRELKDFPVKIGMVKSCRLGFL